MAARSFGRRVRAPASVSVPESDPVLEEEQLRNLIHRGGIFRGAMAVMGGSTPCVLVLYPSFTGVLLTRSIADGSTRKTTVRYTAAPPGLYLTCSAGPSYGAGMLKLRRQRADGLVELFGVLEMSMWHRFGVTLEAVPGLPDDHLEWSALAERLAPQPSETAVPSVAVQLPWALRRQLPAHVFTLGWMATHPRAKSDDSTFASLPGDLVVIIQHFVATELLFDAAHVWGGRPHPCCSAALCETPRFYPTDLCVTMRVGGDVAFNVSMVQRRLQWKHNHDSRRDGKPHAADVVFNEDYTAFRGTCVFPGEGPIGFEGSMVEGHGKERPRSEAAMCC